MTKGEIAASLGHWHVWKHHKQRIEDRRLRERHLGASVKESGLGASVKESGERASRDPGRLATEYCLVLEDDIEFAPAFSAAMFQQAVRDLTAFDPDWGLLYLGTHLIDAIVD